MAARFNRLAGRKQRFPQCAEKGAQRVSGPQHAMSAPSFRKIAVFGVGLIGGSFALALKKAGAVGQIVGAGRTWQSLERAHELGIIDACTTSPAEAVDGADLVLIAAPVAQTGAILASIQPHLGPGTVVTD